MNNFKSAIISIFSIVIIFGIGVLVGKYYFSKTDIKVVDKIVYKTEWKTEVKEKIVYKDKEPEFNQENFDIFYNCYQSPIQFKDRIEKNFLFVKAFDDCKEATVRYEIGQKGNYKIYFEIIIAAAAGYGGYQLYKHLK